MSGQKVNIHIFLLNIATFLSIDGVPFYIPTGKVDSIYILFGGYSLAFHVFSVVEKPVASIDSERQEGE